MVPEREDEIGSNMSKLLIFLINVPSNKLLVKQIKDEFSVRVTKTT